MSIQTLVETLRTNIAALNSVSEPVNKSPDLDSTKILYDTLATTIDANNIHFLSLPDDSSHPSVVYQQVGSVPNYFESHKLTHKVTFVTELREQSDSALIDKTKQLTSALESSNYGIELTNAMQDYDKASKTFRQHLEVVLTVPATLTPTLLPAAIVYQISDNAEPSVYDNMIRQSVTSQFAVAVITAGNDIAQLRNQVRNVVIGNITTNKHIPYQLKQGNPLENEGGITIWRDIFYNSTVRVQS